MLRAGPRLLFGVLCLAAAFLSSSAATDDAKTVGRVRVTTLHRTFESNAESVRAALVARNAPAAGKRFAERRVISVRPRSSDPTRFDATIYDSTVEKAFELVLDAKGHELSRKAIAGQPAPTLEELADALAIVRENAAFAEAVAAGLLTLYEPMPPVAVDAEGRRLVNVGVISRVSAGPSVEKNEIVSVHIPTSGVSRYAGGAPKTANATLSVCGPPASNCSYGNGPCNTYQVQWPAADPVWKLNIRHPSCTSSVQPDGTGLELTDVYYRGRLILKRAEVPVLNVVYDNDVCGPFRDWLFPEDCFQAPGTDVPSNGSGVRIANAPPSTLCESGAPGSDAGNFRGVAIYDEGDALWIMTEMAAGWYRYIMEWRLHLDGTMEPIFGFGATINSCTCNAHFHHAYWRMEWGIDAVSDGNIDDPATGICTLERRRVGTLSAYDPIATEGTFVRPATGGDEDYWRIKNPLTGNGYTLQPSEHDGNATNDPYAKFDLAGLALNAGEINDPQTDTSINIAPWVGGEALGATKRLVTWYHVTFNHDDPQGIGEACEISGPRFVPLTPCAGSLFLDRSGYKCGSPVSITLNDSDLAGTGSTSVGVTSGTEALGETRVLTESPAGSGHFEGEIGTVCGDAVNGDGKISVVDGDSIDIHYLDASSCGTPNVVVDEAAPIDCVPPSITNVQAAPAATQATISWNTSEAASTVVHYGTSPPTGSSAQATGMSTTHSATLTGLSECTTYYYWVESVDAVGNGASSNSGGGYSAFTTSQAVQTIVTSTDTPLDIPNDNPTGAISTIAVADPVTVQDVNVTVNITHTADRDLTLSLITPTETPITLASQRGGSSNHFINTVFDDEAANPISSGTAPFTGSFRPEQPLAAGDGISAAGSWTLKAVDSAAQDVGTINNWTLKLTYANLACAPAGPPPAVPDGSVGAGRTASGVHLFWDAVTCPAKNYHLLYGALQNVSSYALSGAVCGLGPLGGYDWIGPPSGDLWFLIVGDDTAAREGTWGTNGAGAYRAGMVASGLCGFTTRSNVGACP
jgi:subtilisin-like proprotein convertase family protein